MIDLPTIWLIIICIEVGLYIMLDGMDLGIGVLTLVPQEMQKRSLMLHAIGPIWNANETWLVIASGTLFGAFPLAYGVILNALYIPITIMLFGLILRAVSFEFREHALKRFWTTMFGVGSMLVIIGQGFVAGGILNGIVVYDNQFAGGIFDWFSPLSICMTIGILMSYVVVGYAYLIKKAHYELSERSFSRIVVASLVSFVGFFAATLLLPKLFDLFYFKWTTMPTSFFLFLLAGIIAILSATLLYGALRRRFLDKLHALCLGIFACAGLGMIIAAFPYIIPPSITVYDAASSPATQRFMLWGLGPLLPIVMAYNWYMYRVFRGTISEEHSQGGY